MLLSSFLRSGGLSLVKNLKIKPQKKNKFHCEVFFEGYLDAAERRLKEIDS